MNKKLYALFFLGIFLYFIAGCSVKWTDAIQVGNIAQKQFIETIDIDIRNKLIFLPVTINGNEYRFLFDTGAPFSISKHLQDEHDFKVVSEGNIVDSDNNRMKVSWVEVGSVRIGNIDFRKQAAFVGDFEANPLLACLEFDGIIGSNLMRHCNWTIDQEQKSLTFFNDAVAQDTEDRISIPFKANQQYSMFADIKIGTASLSNVLVDYGSTGSISLSDKIFATLREMDIVGEPLIEQGMKQSGIVGKTVPMNRKIVYSNDVSIGEIHPDEVMLRTGKTVSIGNGLLSHYRVTIDWDYKKLHFVEADKAPPSKRYSGFRLSYDANEGIYVQSVVLNSNAYNEGVMPDMKVLKLDTLDFENDHDFCDYVSHKTADEIFLELIDNNGQSKEYHFEQTEYP